MQGGCTVGRAGQGGSRAPQDHNTQANQHKLASNKECTQTCCCRAC